MLAALAAPASAVDGDAYLSLANQKRASVGLSAVGWAASGSHTTSSVTGKLYSVMIFVKLCSAPPPPAEEPPAGGDTTFTRLAGADRYATAAALSRARFGSGASTVFIATGASFPDALAGSPAAAMADGPILLTARDGLPTATANELARLRPSRIVILGGPGVVTDRVAAQLQAHAGTVERWWGATRFETAAAISRATFSPGVPVAYLATGSTFPDALSGGAIAGRNHSPILLVGRDSLPTATADELARLRRRSRS